jgi:hypothetical protein
MRLNYFGERLHIAIVNKVVGFLTRLNLKNVDIRIIEIGGGSGLLMTKVIEKMEQEFKGKYDVILIEPRLNAYNDLVAKFRNSDSVRIINTRFQDVLSDYLNQEHSLGTVKITLTTGLIGSLSDSDAKSLIHFMLRNSNLAILSLPYVNKKIEHNSNFPGTDGSGTVTSRHSVDLIENILKESENVFIRRFAVEDVDLHLGYEMEKD